MAWNHFRKPVIPRGFQCMQYLQSRMDFPRPIAQQYERLKRGYIGEQKFYERMCHLLPENSLNLYSLTLAHQDVSFQLDSLLFFNGKIYLFEIKYYAGDYVVRGSDWFVANSNQSINNPLRQLKRASVFFRQLVRELGWHGQIDGKVVFMHKAFYLYGARLEDPIIFLPQVSRDISRILSNERPPVSAEFRLARLLADRHEVNNRYEQIPTYHYEQVWKGIICPSCYQRMFRKTERMFICAACAVEFTSEAVVLAHIKEFTFCFLIDN